MQSQKRFISINICFEFLLESQKAHIIRKQQLTQKIGYTAKGVRRMCQFWGIYHVFKIPSIWMHHSLAIYCKSLHPTKYFRKQGVMNNDREFKYWIWQVKTKLNQHVYDKSYELLIFCFEAFKMIWKQCRILKLKKKEYKITDSEVPAKLWNHRRATAMPNHWKLIRN